MSLLRWPGIYFTSVRNASQLCATNPRTLCTNASAPMNGDLPVSSIEEMSEDEKITLIRQGIAPATGEPLRSLAADIWGWKKNPVGPGHRSGAKILERPLKGPLYTSWYPESPYKSKLNEFRVSEQQERWREKLRLLRAGGKGPPKKGEGKRKKR